VVLLVLGARRRPPTAGYPWPTDSLLPAESHHRNSLDVKTPYEPDRTIYPEKRAGRPPATGRPGAGRSRFGFSRSSCKPTQALDVLFCITTPQRLPAASPTAPGGQGSRARLPTSGLAAQPLLTDRAEAERAFALAERLGSVNAAAQELGTTWPPLHKAFTRHGLGMPAPNPQAVRQRAIDAIRQRTERPATPSLDPVFVALNPNALPARPRSPAELYQWVRREE
jgi:hypothetical protein